MLKKYPSMKPDNSPEKNAKEWGMLPHSNKQYWIVNNCNFNVGGSKKSKCPCKAKVANIFG